MGDIRDNIISGTIYNNNTSIDGIIANNAFTSEDITSQTNGQVGYNYPQVNAVIKDGHFISSNGTHAEWTTIDDYIVATAPNLATDYLLMWSDADQAHRKILLGDVGGSGGSGTDGEITLWTGSPATLTSSNLFTYETGINDDTAHFKVGVLQDVYLLQGETKLYTDGKSLFQSMTETHVWVKSSSNTAADSGRLILNRTKGGAGIQTLPVLNDTIGEIIFNSGSFSSAHTANPSASITVIAKENFIASTNFGSSLSIKTTKVGQATMSERLLIDSDGTVKVTGQIYSNLPSTVTPIGNAITLDWNTGNGQVINLTSALTTVTVTLTNPKAGAVYLIKVIQSSITPRNITWPASVRWSGSVTPTITTTLNAVDTVALFYDGSTYYANISQNYG